MVEGLTYDAGNECTSVSMLCDRRVVDLLSNSSISLDQASIFQIFCSPDADVPLTGGQRTDPALKYSGRSVHLASFGCRALCTFSRLDMTPTDPKAMPSKEAGDSSPVDGQTGTESQQDAHQSHEVHPGVLTSGRASSSSDGPADGSTSADSSLRLDAEIKVAMFSDHFAEKQSTTPEITFTPAADDVNINVAPISPTNTSKTFSQKEHDTESGGSEEPPALNPPAIEGLRLVLLTVGLCLMVFLISLDRVIVTTVGFLLGMRCLP